MRVLFLQNYLSIEGDPMGIMQLSAIAKRKGWDTELALANENYLRIIEKRRPDLIAVSMMTTDYLGLMHAIREIRQRELDIPIIVGGPHPTYSPDLIEEPEISAICVGEGDLAFQEALERIERNYPLDGAPNLHTRGSKSPLAPLVEDLDSLPFLDREIVYEKSLAMRTFRLRSFYSSRGCPYKCTYCFNHAFNDKYRGLGKIVRKRSVDNLLEEIKQVMRRYPTDYIRFSDDVFVHRIDSWFEEFAEKYPREVGVPFYCLMRANTVDDNLVKTMKEAGCGSVCMSIEAGNPHIREKIILRKMSSDQIAYAFDAFNNAGIKVYTNSIVGLPTSTVETELETLDLNIRCRPAYSGFTVGLPFPGTEMHQFCQREGVLPPEMTTEDLLSFGQESILNCFSKKEKRIQRNMVLLGPLVVKWPFLRKPFTKCLMHLPVNPVYLLIHYFVRNYLFKKHIVPIEFTLNDILTLGFAQVKSEIRTWVTRYAFWKNYMPRVKPKKLWE
jgi:anaerobic magnesium-protoporphyrin IX monomethyl ester cyclase